MTWGRRIQGWRARFKRFLYTDRMKSLAVVIAVASLTTVLAAGQTRATSGAPKPWSPPRTAWGDPDVSGNFTNLYEVGTPFERPDEFAGRRLEDVNGDELAKIRRGIQERTRTEQLAGEIGGTR